MSKYIIIAIITGVIGFFIGTSYHSTSHSVDKTKSQTHEHMDMHMSSEVHHHGQITIPEGGKIPSVDLIVHDDPKSGWNLQIVTKNYTLSPERASTQNRDGEGHMHLHIDDKKITRIYGEWFHLGENMLTPGTHTIKVSLSANNHEDYVYQGSVIADSETIIVKKS